MLCLFIHSSGHWSLNHYLFYKDDHVFVLTKKVQTLLLLLSVSIYIDEAQIFNYVLITHAAKNKSKLPGLLSALLPQGHSSGTNDLWCALITTVLFF